MPRKPLARPFLLMALLVAMLGVPLACSAEPVDLVGTWYVLTHYQDSDTAHPDAYRWDDRIWVIERKGSRLQWTEYPIVVFVEQEGRFERDASGTRGRVLHAWEPNGAQRREIDKGLQVNPRGKKRKTLKLKKGTYRSTGGGAALSASQVTYQEDWSIADPEGLPVFQRVDSLGSARAESMDGITRYSVREVLRGGDEMKGRFERDESRRGNFKMVRAGEVGRVPKRKKREERDDPLGQEADRLDNLADTPLTPEERRQIEAFQERVREVDEALRSPAPADSGRAEVPSTLPSTVVR